MLDVEGTLEHRQGTVASGEVTGPHSADFMRAIYDRLSKPAKDALNKNFAALAAGFREGAPITVDVMLGEVLGRAAQGKTGFFIDAGHLEQTFQQCSGKELPANACPKRSSHLSSPTRT